MQEKPKYVALNFEHVSLIYKIDNNFNFFGPFIVMENTGNIFD